MASKLILFIVISLTSQIAWSARILCIFPVPFDSHQVVFQRLTEELARDGHQLVVLTPLPHKKSVPNVTEIDVHDLSYKMWEKITRDKLKNRNTIKMDSETFIRVLVYETMYPVLEAQFEDPEMQNLIQNKTEHFDLVLVEGCIRPAMMIGARFNAPMILVNTYFGISFNYYTVGAAIDPFIFPEYYVKSAWNLGLWDKLSSVYSHLLLRYGEWQIEKVENAMIRKHFGEGAPTLSELRKNVQMLLLNVHPVWDYNRPVPPNLIYLGALHLKNPEPLKGDLKTYLDNSHNGVVYMSLGSKIRSSDLPPQIVRLILKVFSSLPYDVLWKWETDEIPDKPKNLRVEKWLPQNDMLHHPKIKAFITHAGLQSTDESIAARVPMVGLPIFCDQFANTEKYEQNGIGKGLDIDNLDEDEFRRAIIEVVENQSYRDNIDKLARIMEEQRFGALEKALRWIKHIATHGGHHLRPPLPDLSFIEYYMLDVITAVLLIVLIFVISAILLLKYLLSKLSLLFKSSIKI